MTLRVFTIGELQISQFNVRTNEEDTRDTGRLEASIKALGLLYPLVVHPLKGTKRFGVLAGGRRYRAFKALIARGELPATYPIECMVRDVEETKLIELSLAENLHRELRLYEKCAAVARAHRRGAGVKEIAETNGQTTTTIQRWIRIGNLVPEVFNAYATGAIGQDQAAAFGATEDHALQLHAFRELLRMPESMRSPATIRRLLGIGDREREKLLRFVGEQDYRAAGGRYELDLFADAAEMRGLIADPGILLGLAEAKLGQAREQLRVRAGRELRFAPEYPRNNEHGGIDRQLEIAPEYHPLDASDAQRVEQLHREMTELEHAAEFHAGRADRGEIDADQLAAAIAPIDAEYGPLEQELDAIESRRRLVLPEGDIFATVLVDDAGQLETRWWWASRKAKRAAEAPEDPQSPVSAGPVATPAVIGARAIGDPLERQKADAGIRQEQGLSQDGIQAVRTLRRELLRGLLVDDARSGGTTGSDYLAWSLARHELARRAGGMPALGARGLAPSYTTSAELSAHRSAMPMVEQSAAHRIWQAALDDLGAHASMTEPDLVAAFQLFAAAPGELKRLAATVVAGIALERSANADGYRVPIHDALAARTGCTADALLRQYWSPTPEFLALLPRKQILRECEPHVPEQDFGSWDKLKVADLIPRAAAALQRAAGWVHPLLRFERPKLPPFDPPAARQAPELQEAAE